MGLKNKSRMYCRYPNVKCNLFLVKQLAQDEGKFCLEGRKVYLHNSCDQKIATCGLDQDWYILGNSLHHDVHPMIEMNFNLIHALK